MKEAVHRTNLAGKHFLIQQLAPFSHNTRYRKVDLESTVYINIIIQWPRCVTFDIPFEHAYVVIISYICQD